MVRERLLDAEPGPLSPCLYREAVPGCRAFMRRRGSQQGAVSGTADDDLDHAGVQPGSLLEGGGHGILTVADAGPRGPSCAGSATIRRIRWTAISGVFHSLHPGQQVMKDGLPCHC